MEDTHRPKKSGTGGVLIASLSLAALLALPCAWFAAYYDQLAASTSGPPRPGAAAPPRPSGVIALGLPKPGQTRTVQIQHTGGQVVTTISDSRMTLTMRSVDPRPPSNPLDTLGQSLCDRYNAWKCEKGDPRQTAGLIRASGGTSMSVMINFGSPITTLIAPPAVSAQAPPQAHALGTRAPESPAPPAARTPAAL